MFAGSEKSSRVIRFHLSRAGLPIGGYVLSLQSIPVLSRAFADLRRGFGDLLIIDLACKAVGTVLLYPLAVAVVRMLIGASGHEAVADQAIISFLLSPLGVITLLAIGTLQFGLVGLEMTAVLAGAARVAAGKRVTAREALGFTLRHAPAVVSLASRIWLRLIAILAPFLAAIGLIYATLLTRFDINYYLSERPPVFWLAVGLAAVVVLMLALVVLPRILGWVFALPVVLFEGLGARAAMAASVQSVREHRRTVRQALLIWLVFSVLATSLALGFVRLIERWVIPPLSDRVVVLVPVLGIVLLLWGAAYLLTNIAGTVALGSVGLRLYETLRGNSAVRTDWSHAEGGESILSRISGRTFWWLMAGALIASMVAGGLLLWGVRFDTQVEIIAHRGASAVAPENTMAAFEEAITQETDWIELDVQEAVDGTVVVMHDSDFMKQSRNGLKVWDATVEQLAGLDIGSWFKPEFSAERVALLEDVLLRCKDRSRVLIELKYYGHNTRLEESVAEIVERTGMHDQIQVMSLKYDMVQKMKSVRPTWKVGLLTATAVGNLVAMDGDFLAISTGMATPARIRAAHAAGKKVYVWTVNDPMTMALMVSRGVDGLITDEPALARNVLKRLDNATSGERLVVALAFRFGITPKATDTARDVN